MTPEIRRAESGHREAIVALVQRAFTSAGHDGQEEVDIVTATWSRGATVDGLELVAVTDDAVVGHVLGARGQLGRDQVIGVAPLCVDPGNQRQGVGTALMGELLDRADALKWPLAVVLGDPLYYRRFGFEPAGRLGIVYPPVGKDDPHFQVRRLRTYIPFLRGEFNYCWEQPGRASE